MLRLLLVWLINAIALIAVVRPVLLSSPCRSPS